MTGSRYLVELGFALDERNLTLFAGYQVAGTRGAADQLLAWLVLEARSGS